MHVDASETPLKHDAQICKKLNVQSEVVVDKSTNDLVVQSEKENVPASIDSDLKQQQPSKNSKKKKKKKSKVNSANPDQPPKQNIDDETIATSTTLQQQQQQASLISQQNIEFDNEVSRIIKEIEEITKQKVLLHKVSIFY